MLKTEVLLDGLLFPESPRWYNNKLWFSDQEMNKVMTVNLEGEVEIIIEMENRPSGLGWLPDGKLLIVSMEDRRLLSLDPSGLNEYADLSRLSTFYCNDMVVDKKGRAYVGNFGFDYFNRESFVPAEIVLVTSKGNARVVANDMAFPNGTVITPDEKLLIVAETFATRLTAFNILDDGSLTDRRIWASLRAIPPDGICLDAEGAIWVSAPGRHRVVRVLEGGEITHKVKVETDAYACMLGGPERDILFITTSTDERNNGRIEFVKVDVPGVGLP
ncbi:MAG: SMP-30/gluconolactonase/LRE family protein [Candidatus Lokiarchaeota archaeon]|nr:SMP-30/gluconolactonase/LRE family protein [Candidatus Lokiarchaeota archaeon]